MPFDAKLLYITPTAPRCPSGQGPAPRSPSGATPAIRLLGQTYTHLSVVAPHGDGDEIRGRVS